MIDTELPSIPDLIGGVADTIGGVVNFWSDPFGNMYAAGEEAVKGLSEDLIPAITESTLPDLTLPSFLSTYAVSFALAMLVAVTLLIVQFVRTARGMQSGQETIESIGLYFPAFLIGIMFGPMIGIMVIEVVRALSRSLIQWAYAGTVDQMVGTLVGLVSEDPALLPGGAVVGMFVVWAMALGLLLLVFFFIVQLVVLYFSGVLIPLTVVWVIDPQRRHAGLSAVTLWVGMLLVHPLLFLVLGFSFRIAIDGVGAWGDDGWRNFVMMIVACIAIFAAVLSPFFLVGFVRKTLSQQSGGGSGPMPLPIGAKSPARAPGSSQPMTSQRSQPVRGSATPSVSGHMATVGASSKMSASSKMGAATPAAVRGGTSTAVKAGAGAATAGAATAVAGTVAATKRMRSDADTSVTPPHRETHGKARPE